jgi:hypothetical protein
MKRPIPCDRATLGSLDAHVASVLTSTPPAETMQTTRSPAKSTGALQLTASSVLRDAAVGAVGSALSQAAAVETATTRAATRPKLMARTELTSSRSMGARHVSPTGCSPGPSGRTRCVFETDERGRASRFEMGLRPFGYATVYSRRRAARLSRRAHTYSAG